MNRVRVLIMVMATLLGTATLARGEQMFAPLTGLEEVPVVSTAAVGYFIALTSGDSIPYTLFYTQLQGTVTQAHIHVGQSGVNGGISFFLCQTATNPDPTGLSPQCPQEGTVQGTITAANVIGPTGAQQVSAGDFASVLSAIRAGAAYANVHTNLSTGGEIRGQVKVFK
jgi:CHRD domain